MEYEFDGDQLAPLLLRRGAAGLAAALVGCAIYRDDPEKRQEIVGCDGSRALVRSSHGSVHPVSISGSFILSCDDRISAAVRSLETEEDRTERRMIDKLNALGFPSRVERDDQAALYEILAQADTGALPSRRVRQRAVGLFQKYGAERALTKILKSWSESTNEVPGDIRIELVANLRRLGDYLAAVRQTDCLLQESSALSDMEQAILLTQRAALWLDLYEARNEAKLLERARRAAKRSWGLAQSDACSNVFERLKRLEKEAEEQRAPLATATRDAAVDSAWKMWPDSNRFKRKSTRANSSGS